MFQQGYRGSRYSFGYPACPNLEDRALLMQLLEPAAIGGKLGVRDPVESEEILDLEVARGRLRGGRGQGNGEQERHGN